VPLPFAIDTYLLTVTVLVVDFPPTETLTFFLPAEAANLNVAESDVALRV
jgi:hypothetical protein